MEEEKIIKPNQVNELEYPSVNSAYEIALKFYDWTMQRSDAIDSRVNKFLTWISSITIGLIAILYSKNSQINFHNNYFYIAMSLFLLAILLGATVEFITYLRFISPNILYNEYLHYSEWEFKKDIICFAGDAFDKSIKWINRKAYILAIMIVMFLVEMVCLGIWIIYF